MRWTAALLLLSILGACSPPDEPAAPVAPTPEPTSEPDEATATEPAEVAPQEAVFDIRREDDRIIMSGAIRSPLQIEEVARALTLDGFTLVNEMTAHRQLPGNDWGNRIEEVLVELVTEIPDAHFRVTEGVVTLGGTVASRQDINKWQRAIVYVMDSPYITGFNNELKTADGTGVAPPPAQPEGGDEAEDC